MVKWAEKRKELSKTEEFIWTDVDFGDFEAAKNSNSQSMGYRNKNYRNKILRYGGYTADFPISERSNFGIILDKLLENIAKKRD